MTQPKLTLQQAQETQAPLKGRTLGLLVIAANCVGMFLLTAEPQLLGTPASLKQLLLLSSKLMMVPETSKVT